MRSFPRSTFRFSVRLLLAFSLPAIAIAQDTAGMRSARIRYRASEEITLTAIVAEVKASRSTDSRGPLGTYLVVQIGSETFDVHLGPRGTKRLSFFPGDRVEVTGFRPRRDDTLLLARTVKKGDQILTVRDARGFLLGSRSRPFIP